MIRDEVNVSSYARPEDATHLMLKTRLAFSLFADNHQVYEDITDRGRFPSLSLKLQVMHDSGFEYALLQKTKLVSLENCFFDCRRKT